MRNLNICHYSTGRVKSCYGVSKKKEKIKNKEAVMVTPLW